VKKAIRWAVVTMLLVFAIFIGIRMNNNRVHRQDLAELLALPALKAYTLIDSISYVGAAQSGCMFFAGVSFCTSATPEQVVAGFVETPHAADNAHLTFVWAVGDSFAAQPIGMGKVVSPMPINISWMGGDVNKGVKQLWNSGTCTSGRMLVFTAIPRSNWGDLRCF
jgi:hypothetical protein